MPTVAPLVAFSLSVLAVATAHAQTIVVDAANGPGTNYTAIQPAVQAAPSGAIVVVRAGAYAQFAVSGKGIAVLCEPGVIVAGATLFPAIEVTQVPAGESFVLRGCRNGAGELLLVRNCAGAVLVEDAVGFSYGVLGCAQVALRSCTGRASASGSELALERCVLRGRDAVTLFGQTTPASEALRLVGGTTQLVDTTLVGGDGIFGFIPYANAPGLTIDLALVRILGTSMIAAGSGVSLPGASAIVGTGSVRLDPGVVLTPSSPPAIDPRVSVQVAAMPAVRSDSAGPGGTMVGEALGPAGNPVVLVLGLPALPLALPGFADAFWIHPAAFVFAAIGVPQPAQPVTASIALPVDPALRGQRLAWQSVTPSGTGLEASNPSLAIVQ